MVDSRLEPHDANQLELKLGYKVRPERKRQRYLVESFMFVPRTLGVSARSYGPERFFEDTSTFIRLSTPAVALEALASEGRAASWFAPLGEELDALSAGRAASADGLVRSLKLLGSIYRAAIRDQGRLLLAGLAALPAPGAPKAEVREGAWVASMARFAEHLRAATARLRSAAQRCELANVPRAVAETWSAVDEHVSLCVEGRATALVAACDARGARAGGSPLSEVRDRLADVATDEYRYRQGRGYPSKAVAGEANEALPFRRRLLKRITSSVLFLDSEYEPGGELQRDLIAGVAAAAAMLFAVLVAIWAQVHWGALSATFAAVMVVAYIVKDRIKERGKRYLGRRLAGRLPDYVVKVRDPHSGRAIGVCREAVTVTEPSHIDADVRALRRADHDTVIGDDGRPEVVIHYAKRVSLSSAGLQAALAGVDGLTDIIRFNFSHFRRRMDAAVESYRIVDPRTRAVVSIACARVYHVNLVLRISQGRGRDRIVQNRRVRVILSQEGIERVEAVDTRAVVRAVAVAESKADPRLALAHGDVRR